MENYFKQLLLKDLCSRLPYNLYCKVEGIEEPVKVLQIEVSNVDGILLNFNYKIDNLPLQVYLSEVKPYLRPLSSMSDEEFGFLQEHLPYDFTRIYSEKFNLIDDIHLGDSISIDDMAFLLDYLNKRHFDYRGLIEKGLAIDCTNLNIY